MVGEGCHGAQEPLPSQTFDLYTLDPVSCFPGRARVYMYYTHVYT